MCISDWSSDLCSSELVDLARHDQEIVADAVDDDAEQQHRHDRGIVLIAEAEQHEPHRPGAHADHQHALDPQPRQQERQADQEEGFENLPECLDPRRLQTPAEQVHMEIRSEEHTSELQSLMRISYAVFCLKKKK